MTILYDLDEYKIFKKFTEIQIEKIAEKLGIGYEEALFYLWFWHTVNISPQDREINKGENMYKKFAIETVRLLRGRFL